MAQTNIKRFCALIIAAAAMATIGFFAVPVQTQAVTNDTQIQRPKKVKKVRAHARYKKKIRVRWKAQKNIDLYQIQVRQGGEVVKTIRVRKGAKKGKRYVQHTIKNLEPGNRYVVRIRAKRKGAKPKAFGKYSKRIRVWTKGARPETDAGDEESGNSEEPGDSDEESDEESEEKESPEGDVDEETPAEEEGNEEESPEESEQQPEESEEESGEEGSEEEEEVVEETPEEEAEDPEEEADPILFGFWGLNSFITEDGLEQVQTDFNSTVFQVASSGPGYTVNTLLPLVKESGMKVTLRMTPGPDYNNDFDIEAWKDHIDTWADSGVQDYIDDGTLVGHMLLDDILNFSYISDSTNPTGDELDEMARYSEEAFPGLMTFVRQQASGIPVPTGGEFTHLDAVVNQYRHQEGDVETYVATESAAADTLNVRSIYGMNIVDGGDGSSAQEGIRSEKYAMTATEITAYGEVLLAAADMPLFLMWEFDGQALWQDGTTIGSDYFSQTDLKAALAGLGTIAAGE